jgi:hypothetical protein
MRRSVVLILPPQLVFPAYTTGETYANICVISDKKCAYVATYYAKKYLLDRVEI